MKFILKILFAPVIAILAVVIWIRHQHRVPTHSIYKMAQYHPTANYTA